MRVKLLSVTCGHSCHLQIILINIRVRTDSRWNYHAVQLSCSVLLKFEESLMLLLLLRPSFELRSLRSCRLIIPNHFSISLSSWASLRWLLICIIHEALLASDSRSHLSRTLPVDHVLNGCRISTRRLLIHVLMEVNSSTQRTLRLTRLHFHILKFIIERIRMRWRLRLLHQVLRHMDIMCRWPHLVSHWRLTGSRFSLDLHYIILCRLLLLSINELLLLLLFHLLITESHAFSLSPLRISLLSFHILDITALCLCMHIDTFTLLLLL